MSEEDGQFLSVGGSDGEDSEREGDVGGDAFLRVGSKRAAQEEPGKRKKRKRSSGDSGLDVEENIEVIHFQTSKKKKKKTPNPTMKKLNEKKLVHQREERKAIKGVKSKKLKGILKHQEQVMEEATTEAAASELFLLPSEAGYLEVEELEKSCRVTQDQIVGMVDIQAQRNRLDLELVDPPLGPYSVAFSRTGQHMLFGGELGHVAVMHWSSRKLISELHLNEKVRDVTFLHNHMFYATAQKKHAYIYDISGTELHRLKDHIAPQVLSFLPHHFLLASASVTGDLVYQDTSTGALVAKKHTGRGPCRKMCVNPYNGVVCLGHRGGVVTMWSPTMSEPLVKLLSHRGAVNALAVDGSGTYMATAGMDKSVKIWDIRMFKELLQYYAPAPASSLTISQRSLLAVGCRHKVQIWKDAFATRASLPYMEHSVMSGAQLNDLKFCPYEDMLAIGHSRGLSTILVPGAGEPNFDSMVENPFQTRKQRKEAEVHALLEKIQPEMIVLDPDSIGRVDPSVKDLQQEDRPKEEKAKKEKVAQRGRYLKRKLKKKSANVVTAQRMRAREHIDRLKKERDSAGSTIEAGGVDNAALSRFK